METEDIRGMGKAMSKHSKNFALGAGLSVLWLLFLALIPVAFGLSTGMAILFGLAFVLLILLGGAAMQMMRGKP